MKKEKTPECRHRMPIGIVAKAKLPTAYGRFKVYAFCNHIDNKEHVAIVKGNVRGRAKVPLRLHSECLTGDVFHSLRCDCNAQLEAALKKMHDMPRGVILYLRQEGRGIGITNKIRAYELQDRGRDTVQANLELGFPADMRNYKAAAGMIKEMGIKSVCLITNNPAKTDALLEYGIRVERRIPHEFGKQKYNSAYLEVKKRKMAHILS